MPDFAILVVSCDKYSDVWDPFFSIFAKRWPDCPYPVFLGTGHKTCSAPGVTSIRVGDDKTWAENLLAMLAAVDAPRILMFLEDFLLTGQVPTEKVASLLRVAVENDVGCLRLVPHRPSGRPVPQWPGLGEIRRGEEYRVSTQVAIWEDNLLRSLAWPGFSAWDFELIGSLISDRLPGRYWSVLNPVVAYCNGVIRGKWMPSGLSTCRDAGVAVDLTARSAFTPAEILGSHETLSMKPRHILLRHLPPFAVRLIRLYRGKYHIERFLSEAGLANPPRSL